jgi:hypothetical protein
MFNENKILQKPSRDMLERSIFNTIQQWLMVKRPLLNILRGWHN